MNIIMKTAQSRQIELGERETEKEKERESEREEPSKTKE